MAIPVGLILVITLVDIHSPTYVHLGPLLVIAPAITASFGGARLTGLIGALAVGAQLAIAVLHGGLSTTNHIAQLVALTILSVFVMFVCLIRDRRTEELAQVRSVSEAAQRALLRPLPHRLGPLHIASTYLAAEKEACIGGDLYAVARIGSGTRVIIADVRGKGLGAIGEAATLLGAFQEAAHHHATLPALAQALDRSVCRYHTQIPESDEEAQEHFVTALMLEIPDHAPMAQVTHCGHPPPLLIRHGEVLKVANAHPAPPLGIGGLATDAYGSYAFTFQVGDTLLLYTDGIVEARDRDHTFYPLEERVALWTRCSPDTLVHRIQRDLLTYADGALGDDAAVVAIHRTHLPHAGHMVHPETAGPGA
ncbi:PP2C family protein-serine/threonine phosphatase [Streptomyces sp. TP-A0356]|uniref:PP2C family protein-serine/threonine phosphatase n=1 Tax=Streptomyces sp. TP-A0356 TaxID=1359208 RepID=UPI000A6CD047|nr:PP2C family protein-serine/threonine phosphatase [Streptomyces sp. TP-A0356]